MDMRLARQSAFPLHRHFLLLAENAGCILQAIGRTNLSRNKEEKKEQIITSVLRVEWQMRSNNLEVYHGLLISSTRLEDSKRRHISKH